MTYHQFEAEDGTNYGSFETFYMRAGEIEVEAGDEPSEAGWYWWACFQGCLPDGDAMGPFESEAKALADALDA
jgi:hypothetical protein